ncbi:hypothetical protein L21SP5_01486 [Salinivirga cyanobacteriivorans]|uniref:Lipocalin-like domain-containing protein n=1 Tax=Salinivirga cyanobacteriivorans TaxID=1307839 RepID=A0A0S2HYP3_9BACT|nr:hypothetical protein [Salinivirga cyanobacteriivorans]ALO15134.1 hypothetical protein L21SP5_01486 [Salinivirga cyanobacteriivorans]
MKKTVLILLTLVFAIAACEKEDEKTYDQTDLYGTWKQITPYPAEEDHDSAFHIFTETEYEIKTYSNGYPTSFTFEYTFDGKSFKYNLGVDITNKINTLTSTKLDFTMSAMGTSENYSCTKVE